MLRAAEGSSAAAGEALNKLCKAYWQPLYAFARRWGCLPADAEDVTQGFFARLLERNDLASVGPERGRFRSFLLTSLRHFLTDEWRRGQTLKRGGGQCVIELDCEASEHRYLLEPADAVTPEVLFERRWAWTVIERVMVCLRAEYVASGKEGLFEELKDFLACKQETPHQEIAARLGIQVSTVAVAVHRLRRRYAEILREEIGQTVGSPAEVEDEIRHLIAAAGS